MKRFDLGDLLIVTLAVCIPLLLIRGVQSTDDLLLIGVIGYLVYTHPRRIS